MKEKLLKQLRKPFNITFDGEVYKLYWTVDNATTILTYKKDEINKVLNFVHEIMSSEYPLNERLSKRYKEKLQKEMNTNKILF